MHTIRVLDALTVVVLLEHLDPDDTIITVWHTRYYGSNQHIHFNADVEPFHPAPVQTTMCLRCLLTLVGVSRISDGRADLLRLVKEGSVQVCAVGERDDVTKCGKCNTLSTTR